MNERDRFVVLSGGGRIGQPTASARLVAVAPAPAPDQISLGPWATAPSGRRMISAGFQGIDLACFRQLLITFNVRHIVDIRALSAFRSRGFQPDIVLRIFDELGVHYEQIRLANVFEASTRNPHLARAHYERFLRDECSESLANIARRIEAAPLMLLGSGVNHFGGERELLARHLGRFISMQVIAHEGSAPDWHVSPYLVDGPGGADSTESAPRSGRRSPRTPVRQLALNW